VGVDVLLVIKYRGEKMTVKELIEFLTRLDDEMIVEISDSSYPNQEIEKQHINVRNGKVVIY
jgi:sulfur carrier protein ThiS